MDTVAPLPYEEVEKLVYKAFHKYKPLKYFYDSSLYDKETLVQEALMEIYRRLPQYNGKYKFSTFVYVVSHRIWWNLNLLQYTKRKLKLNFVGSTNRKVIAKEIGEFVTSDEDVEKTVLEEIMFNNVRNQLNDREIELLECFILKINPITLKKLGKKYGVSQEAMRLRLLKLKEKLRLILDEML